MLPRLFVVVFVRDCPMHGDTIETQGGTFRTRSAAEYAARKGANGREWYVKAM